MRVILTHLILTVFAVEVGFGATLNPVADAAMKKGNNNVVRTLLAQKADVNAPQPNGATALQWAVYNDDFEMVDTLIAAGANVKTPNHDGATPLFLACENGSAAVIEKLLKAGADPNERGPAGDTPLIVASRTGNVDAVRMLLDHMADVNTRETIRGTSALMWAAGYSDPAILSLLIERGADLEATTMAAAAPFNLDEGVQQFSGPPNDRGGGLTALVYAARENCLECARILLDAGANIDQTTKYGWSPLLTATQNKHYHLASFLLDRGANPNIPNNGGWSPLYLAANNRNIESGDYPVRAPDMDHIAFIKKLIGDGADVNSRVCGIQSIATECRGDSTETRNNFTMQWSREDGATPFLRAAQSGDVALMSVLLAHGADPKIATDSNVTALAVASGIGWVEGVTFEWSEAENFEAVKMLLDMGLDPNATSLEGRAALHGAAYKGRNAVIQLLVEHGAKLDQLDFGSPDTGNGDIRGQRWIPLNYAEGWVRVGVRSALAHPMAAALIRTLMTEKGLEVPPPITSAFCITNICEGHE